MGDGLVAELTELIALKRYVTRAHFRPISRALRVGEHQSKHRGRGMDFAEVRHYQGGDDIRQMEWRITAKTGKPHIKLYQEERERSVILLMDFNASMYFGTRWALKSVIAARLASLIIWLTVSEGDKAGALLFSSNQHHEFMPRARANGILPLLSAISDCTKALPNRAEPQQKIPLSDWLVRLRRVARPGSLLILISDFYQLDAACEAHLKRLRVHNDVLAYHLCDPLEMAPPKPQPYVVTNGTHELLFDTSQVEIAESYHLYCQHRIENVRALFKQAQIECTSVTGGDYLPLLLRRTYPRRVHG